MAKKKDDILKEFLTLPGVGMSRAKNIYEAGFETMEQLSKASVNELIKIKGVTKKVAMELHENLNPEGSGEKKKPKKEKKSDADILLDRGIGLYNKGKWGQALQIISDVLQDYPDNERALQHKGDIFLEREKYDMAMESYEKLMDINPKLDAPLVGYGEALRNLKRESEARPFYKKAIKLNPTNEIAME